MAAGNADNAGNADDAGGTDAAALSYEQAREQLTTVVKRLEAGGLTLEQSIELWERGERLAAICTQWLDGARARLAAALARQQDEQQSSPRPGKADESEAPF